MNENEKNFKEKLSHIGFKNIDFIYHTHTHTHVLDKMKNKFPKSIYKYCVDMANLQKNYYRTGSI